MDDELSIKQPKPFAGRLNGKLLQAWLKELQRYNEALKKWDARLEDKLSMLNAWEARLLAETESRKDEFDDGECSCPMCDPHSRENYTGEPEDDECDCTEADAAAGCGCAPCERRRAARPGLAAGKTGPIRPIGVPVVDAGIQKDIDELEKMYKLPDKRRKKKQ